MSGGDSRISGGGAAGGQSALRAVRAGSIDANSKGSGDFTEKRTVGGKDVWLTPGGAKALDKLQAAADDAMFELKVEKHPGALHDMFWNTHDDPTTIGKS
jgi:hypothetical protein